MNQEFIPTRLRHDCDANSIVCVLSLVVIFFFFFGTEMFPQYFVFSTCFPFRMFKVISTFGGCALVGGGKDADNP